jgi:2-polyprenyl-3-methyl-5-hydroxy-6-metoxy-1,4-benzoquinol methylase
LSTEEKETEVHIATAPALHCYLCGEPGELLYQNLTDRHFGVSGQWNFRKCKNSACGIVWLDPLPLEKDIGKAYQNYYTHGKNSRHDNHASFARKVLRRGLRIFFSFLKRITLIRQERKRLDLMYLDRLKPGRMLEIGCGNGSRLARMHALGWEVEGQEVDPGAAESVMQAHNFILHLGVLHKLSLPDASYDAVIMNHVIEHIHDPIGILSECYRILKPDGTLVLTTPNSESLGHKTYQSAWMGLDPPRHLYIFSQKTLSTVVMKAGFRNFEVFTTSAKAEAFATGSLNIKYKGFHVMGALPGMKVYAEGMFFQLFARFFHMRHSGSGEECVVKAQK